MGSKTARSPGKRIEQRRRDTPDEPPSTGRFFRIDPRVPVGHGDASRGNPDTGRRETGEGKLSRRSSHVREARREAEERHAVLRARVQADEVARREPRGAGQLFQIGSRVAAVAGRQMDGARWSRRWRRGCAQKERLDFGMPEPIRIEEDEQRARGGDRVEQPRGGLARKPGRESARSLVCRGLRKVRVPGQHSAVGEVAHLHRSTC